MTNGLSMNRLFGVPALAGPDRLKAGLQTIGVPTDRFMVPMHAEKKKGLSLNPRVPPASCRQTNRRKALPARCRQHLSGPVSPESFPSCRKRSGARVCFFAVG